jgi:hypothetical protein
VQDKLFLSADEESAIDLKTEITSGQDRVVWNPTLPAGDHGARVGSAAERHRSEHSETAKTIPPLGRIKHFYLILFLLENGAASA